MTPDTTASEVTAADVVDQLLVGDLRGIELAALVDRETVLGLSPTMLWRARWRNIAIFCDDLVELFKYCRIEQLSNDLWDRPGLIVRCEPPGKDATTAEISPQELIANLGEPSVNLLDTLFNSRSTAVKIPTGMLREELEAAAHNVLDRLVRDKFDHTFIGAACTANGALDRETRTIVWIRPFEIGVKLSIILYSHPFIDRRDGWPGLFAEIELPVDTLYREWGTFEVPIIEAAAILAPPTPATPALTSFVL